MALGKFLKHLNKKRPEMVTGDWIFNWNNAPVHTAVIVKDLLAARSIQVLPLPPLLARLAPADFFLFRKMKEKLAGLHLTQKSLGRGPEDHR